MIRDGINLHDAIKIRQIRSRNVKKDRNQPNQNYAEFREVYRGVFNVTPPNESRTSFTSSIYSESSERRVGTSSINPGKTMKTVRLEWPPLGAEGAILPPKNRPVKKNAALKPLIKQKPKAQEISGRWNKVEKQMKDGATSPKMLIEKASADIDLAAEQLERIRSIMKSRSFPSTELSLTQASETLEKTRKSGDGVSQSDKARKRPKTPTYKAKKKYDRHYDCINNKYMATLTTMKQKLQKLEEKYFKKPQVVYKNVRDIFTQPSSLEVLYTNTQPSDEVKIEEVFRGIKMDLDAIANTKIDDGSIYEYSSHCPSSPGDGSFRKRFSFGEVEKSKVSYSRIIDQSENKLSRLRTIKHNVVDVESFCDKLCKIAEDEEERRPPSPIKPKVDKRNVMFNDTKHGIFDDTELQKSVSKSAYLMKEFNIEPGLLPTVKVFSDSSSFIRTRDTFLDAGEGPKKGRKKPSDHSITSLIENLNMALNNSLYKPVHS